MGELNFERACDWDLQAIVIGQTKVISNIMEMPPSYSWLEDYYQNQENATLLLNELHQICTPNYHNISNISSPKTLDNTMIAIMDDKSMECPIDEPKQNIEDVSYATNLEMAPKRRFCWLFFIANSSIRGSHGKIAKSKFKKTLVHQATGDRVLSDKWNWRKYGEKVIKGSPYPRSYYRCSNSGGCLARKQVEQSLNNPEKFLITYIDEHNHPYPSRRPSQAGRTSKRFNTSTKVTVTTCKSANMSSAKTIVAEDNDDDTSVKCLGRGEYVTDCVFGDDFFAGLEGLEMDVICDMQWRS